MPGHRHSDLRNITYLAASILRRIRAWLTLDSMPFGDSILSLFKNGKANRAQPNTATSSRETLLQPTSLPSPPTVNSTDNSVCDSFGTQSGPDYKDAVFAQLGQIYLDPSVSARARKEIIGLAKTIEEIRNYFQEVLRKLEELDNQCPSCSSGGLRGIKRLAPAWREWSRVSM